MAQKQKHLGAGSQTFTLSSGCKAQFPEHLVLSDLNIKMPEDVLHFTWDWVPADLFDAPAEKSGSRSSTISNPRNRQAQVKGSSISDISIDEW
jgi:hypothetical protein